MNLPTLTTARLVLREPTLDDADAVLRFRGDPEVQRFNDRTLADRGEAAEFLRAMAARSAAGHQRHWLITAHTDVVGMIGLHSWAPGHQRAELGYDLARAQWGHGYAVEAARAVLAHGFGAMDLHRVEAYTIVDNVRSVRLLERLGFTREGTRRAYIREDDGRRYDSAVYGLLIGEGEGHG